MSLINLAAIVLTSDYSTLFMLEFEITEEARKGDCAYI